MVKSILKRCVGSLGYEIHRSGASSHSDSAKYAEELWKLDPLFQRLWQMARQITLVPEQDAYNLYQLMVSSSHLKGDIAEIGVYRGGTATILGYFADQSGKNLHLFDTFTGMPETDPTIDRHKKGDFQDTSLEQVKANLSTVRNAVFHQGFFPFTAGPVQGSTFCFVHVDVDIYRSVKDCCEFFYSRLQTSGTMLFDDYGVLTCPGALKAVDEFFADKPEKPFYVPSGRCFIVKQP